MSHMPRDEPYYLNLYTLILHDADDDSLWNSRNYLRRWWLSVLIVKEVMHSKSTRMQRLQCVATPVMSRKSRKTASAELMHKFSKLLKYELPTDLREPRQTQSPSLSPTTHGISSSSSLPSSRSPLASSLTRSVFHSELKTWLFTKSFPP